MSKKGSCRHGMEVWCEDCATESWVFGKAVGREEGIQHAITLIGARASAVFLSGADVQAKALRDLVLDLDKELKKAKDETEVVRVEQERGRHKKKS